MNFKKLFVSLSAITLTVQAALVAALFILDEKSKSSGGVAHHLFARRAFYNYLIFEKNHLYIAAIGVLLGVLCVILALAIGKSMSKSAMGCEIIWILIITSICVFSIESSVSKDLLIYPYLAGGSLAAVFVESIKLSLFDGILFRKLLKK